MNNEEAKETKMSDMQIAVVWVCVFIALAIVFSFLVR